MKQVSPSKVPQLTGSNIANSFVAKHHSAKVNIKSGLILIVYHLCSMCLARWGREGGGVGGRG